MSQANRSVEEAPDHPDLPVKPPLVFLFATVVGLGLHRLAPMRAVPEGWAVSGFVLVGAAAVLLSWSLWQFRKHETSVRPWKPTRVILQRGPFAFSRNPIYLSFALLQLGIGVGADRLAVVLMLVPAVLATHVIIIAREEAYLERKFGPEYVGYKARVRRWV